MGSRLGQRASKCACLVVPPLFRADSGTNLIKQGENVKGRPCGSVAQLAECSHGKREALGSSPGRATIFSSPVTVLTSMRRDNDVICPLRRHNNWLKHINRKKKKDRNRARGKKDHTGRSRQTQTDVYISDTYQRPAVSSVSQSHHSTAA